MSDMTTLSKYKLEIVKFIILTIFFTLLIFFIKNYFSPNSKNNEEEYIEYSVKLEKIKEIKKVIEERKINKLTLSQKNQIKDHFREDSLNNSISFSYFPPDSSWELKEVSNLISFVIKSSIFSPKIDNSMDPKWINIEIHKDLIDVRWNMKNKTVKLFWTSFMDIDEVLTVFIHEFSHYIDIYYLQKQVFDDISIYFYDISWESTKTIIPWQKQTDFVSWYAMSNKYEDFAESMTYYILHNDEFLEKTKNSIFLKEKYDYFSKYLFKNKEFKNTNFSISKEVENYYWDITKIKINIKNFLQYLENGI